ncbi:MAG TPA: hypothetical protein VNJ04_13830 [Gemmatimonadaceae bacterium]|nr:hypothetical protein [Gemmatimonadaceae bacterium]
MAGVTDAPAWVVDAAHDAGVMERNALRFIYESDEGGHADVVAARTVLRLARGLRRKLEGWQRREADATAR